MRGDLQPGQRLGELEIAEQMGTMRHLAFHRRGVDQAPTEVVVPDDAPLAGIPTFIKDNEEVAGFLLCWRLA